MNKADKKKTDELYKHGFALMDISEHRYLIIADYEGFNNSCFVAKDDIELDAFIHELSNDEEESK